jgi:hypothetical protein
MTIQQADTIDFVALSPAGDEVWLVMVQAEEWGDSGHQLPALQAKVETYLNYALDELVTAYPEATDKRIHVQLRTADPPGEREREFLRIEAPPSAGGHPVVVESHRRRRRSRHLTPA